MGMKRRNLLILLLFLPATLGGPGTAEAGEPWSYGDLDYALSRYVSPKAWWITWA